MQVLMTYACKRESIKCIMSFMYSLFISCQTWEVLSTQKHLSHHSPNELHHSVPCDLTLAYFLFPINFPVYPVRLNLRSYFT